MQKVKENKKDCCGCGACAEICPCNIIEMLPDEEGFLYAFYDEKKCIHCGKCEKVCPEGTEKILNKKHIAYAVKNRRDAERMKSTSGAVFPLLSNKILKDGGVVVGVCLDSSWHVVYDIGQTPSEIQRFRNSKYVQSNMSGIYEKIANLSLERKILFTGTPCQSAALGKYLSECKRGRRDNVIICDLICGKAVSPQIWEKYVRYLKEKYEGNMVEFIFRDKKAGWAYAKPKATINDKSISKDIEEKCNWMELYTHSEFCRPSCYYCSFTTPRRNSDITIGDFWGVENVVPGFYDNKGVSLVIVHNKKGYDLLKAISHESRIKRCTLEDCLQDRLKFPTPEPEHREKFWQDYYSLNFEDFLIKYASMTKGKIFIFGTVLPLMKRLGIYNMIWNLTHKRVK